MWELKQCDWMGDWYSIEGWTPSVEGTKEQWLQALSALDSGTDIWFKRLAVAFEPEAPVVRLFSPRNAVDEDEHLHLFLEQVPAFVAQAREVLESTP